MRLVIASLKQTEYYSKTGSLPDVFFFLNCLHLYLLPSVAGTRGFKGHLSHRQTHDLWICNMS